MTVSKQAARYFKVDARPTTLAARGAASVAFLIEYHTKAQAPVTASVRVHTNLSAFDIPLHIYDGHVHVALSSIEQNVFDFG